MYFKKKKKEEKKVTGMLVCFMNEWTLKIFLFIYAFVSQLWILYSKKHILKSETSLCVLKKDPYVSINQRKKWFFPVCHETRRELGFKTLV